MLTFWHAAMATDDEYDHTVNKFGAISFKGSDLQATSSAPVRDTTVNIHDTIACSLLDFTVSARETKVKNSFFLLLSRLHARWHPKIFNRISATSAGRERRG